MNIQQIKLEFKEIQKNNSLPNTFIYSVVASKKDTKHTIISDICFFFELEPKDIIYINSTTIPFKTRSSSYRYSEKRPFGKKFSFRTTININILKLLQKYAFSADVDVSNIQKMIEEKQLELDDGNKK